MSSEDFLDELPVGKTAAKPARQPAQADEMADALSAAARPAKKIIKKVVRKVTSPPVSEEPAAPAKPVTRPVSRPVTKSVTKPAPVAPTPIQYETLGDDSLPPPGDLGDHSSDDAPLADLPTQSRVVPRPEVIEGQPMDFVSEVAASDREINQRWDEFLTSLEQGTLIALYELGVESLTQFREFSFDDLKKPRGRLTDAQAREVRDKLVGFGVQLSRTSRMASLRQGGGQTRIRGLRAPARGLPPPPADASPLQRRQHRMARNRLTM